MPWLHYGNETDITRSVALGDPLITTFLTRFFRLCADGPDREQVPLDATSRAPLPSALRRTSVVTR